ncbi:T9SS type A sorting domain-containing protein [Hymenobacter sp. ASUV-10]|uniref:T9SS type A sorting domain-containing protein n=1 Tax=Hymenobacter aranciens TaxID=3063996 RepID=A0ABT9BFH7_9BACT|nr:T9SS type A sorting domain-containing protein [Hymenobacter sp. ASUV-10]MDO7875263.1 T9SS type A sorting domain-containing protein [Hymenobacter sp. ASUV-10]
MASASGDDLDTSVFPGLPIGFTFQFAGVAYTSFTLSSNGFITFGSTPPSIFDTPISTSTGFDGSVSGFGADLYGNISSANGDAGELRYQTLGSAPNRTLVVQFKNFQPIRADFTLLNFQIRLEEGSNRVNLVYGAFLPEAGLNSNGEVGLRGAGSNAAYNNRTTTTDWVQSVPGTNRFATMLLTPTVKPPLGLVYTFTPPNSCASPRNLGVTNLTDNSAQLTFTAASPTPAGGYTVTTTPASGGGSQAVSSSPYTLTGLTAGTTYTASLVSNCSGGVTSVPATVTFTTVATCTVPTAVSIGNIGITSADVSFTAGNGNTSFVATATPVAGGNGVVTASGTASPLTLTGLTGGIRYNVTVTGTCADGTTLTSSPAVAFVTLPANDEPSGALALTIGATCLPTNASNIGSTTTAPIGYTNPGNCSPAANPQDVWFRFTTPATGATAAGVRIAVAGTAAGTVRVFSSAGGAAGPFTTVGCSTGATNNTQAPAFDVPGLTPSTTYYVSVAGFGSNDVENTFTICVSTPNGCSTPNNVAATNVTTTTASVNFTPASGAVTYTVTYTAAGGTAQTATGNTTPIALTGLAPATTYSLTVASNCGGGQTSTSAASTFTTATPPCIAPTNVAANSVTTTTASIAFTAGLNANTYTVNYTAAGSSTTQTATGTTSPIALSGLTPTTTYSVTVTSNCDFNQNTTSAPAITFTTATPPCVAPTNVAANSVTTNTASIAFTGGAGATTYTVTYTAAGGTAQTATGTASPIALSGLTAGTSYTATVTSNCGGPTATSSAISFTTPVLAPGDLTVTSGQVITASGPYNNITVQAGGTLVLTGATTATGAVTVQGILATNCQSLSGAGSFALAAGAELRICDAAGIAASGNTGAVQLTGTRSFSADASYVYYGIQAQTTGSGLPAQVRNLTVNTPAGLTLSQAVSVRQLARLQNGNLTTGGRAFTLLSVSGQGTAVLDNTGGVVVGAGTMQRAIDNNNAAGIGYRHYAAPVSNTTIGDLAAPGFTPVLNPAYNTVAQPGLVTPFPTVFGYDQNRVTTVTSDFTAFEKGWFSPAATTDAMLPNRGYTANVANGVLVDFTGTFNNAAQTPGALTRNPGNDTGWHLLGNPYPSPLDWTSVTPAQRPGMDAAMYIFQSTGQYAGTYRTFLPGISDPLTNSPLVDAGQGYFVRVTTPGTAGTVNLTNANRVTTFGPQPAFGRGTASALVQLQISTATQADDAFVYFNANATAGFDASQDAAKLNNPSGLSLATLAGTEALAINGLPLPGANEILVPLRLSVPAAGTYTFRVAALPTMPTAGQFYLRDTQAGTQLALSAGTTHAVQLSAAGTSTGRFVLVYQASGALATQAGLEASQVSIFPNPAHGQFTVVLPPVAGQTKVQASLLNALGQVVSTRTIGLTAGGATAEYLTTGLATGIYMLRLEAGGAAIVRRVVVE